MSNIGTIIHSFFNYEFIGKDLNENKFYQSKKKLDNQKRKRIVIYSNENEPSAIQPDWHSWLHYTTDKIPNNQTSYQWQKKRLANKTGNVNLELLKKNNNDNSKLTSQKKYTSWNESSYE